MSKKITALHRHPENTEINQQVIFQSAELLFCIFILLHLLGCVNGGGQTNNDCIRSILGRPWMSSEALKQTLSSVCHNSLMQIPTYKQLLRLCTVLQARTGHQAAAGDAVRRSTKWKHVRGSVLYTMVRGCNPVRSRNHLHLYPNTGINYYIWL